MVTSSAESALEDAQRKAVESAVGTMISAETVMENYQIISTESSPSRRVTLRITTSSHQCRERHLQGGDQGAGGDREPEQ